MVVTKIAPLPYVPFSAELAKENARRVPRRKSWKYQAPREKVLEDSNKKPKSC
jgi:hypothetical protein